MNLKGLLPASVTPFTNGGDIDERSLDQHLRSVLTDGVTGVVVNGHIGEMLALSAGERALVIEAARSIKREDQVVFSGVFASHPAELVEQAKVAQDAGADGLLLLPPVDVRPYRRLTGTPDALNLYLDALASDCDLPVILHQYPLGTGAAYSLDVLAEVTTRSNVVAIKAASVTTTDYVQLWDRLNGQTRILIATDAPALFQMLMHGYHGLLIGIAAFAPRLWLELCDLVERDPNEAYEMYRRWCIPLMDLLFDNQLASQLASEASAVKVALATVGEIEDASVRRPLVAVNGKRQESIVKLASAMKAEQWL